MILTLTPYPVSTRRRFNVHTTSITVKRRRMDVKTTSCAYWVTDFVLTNSTLMNGNDLLIKTVKIAIFFISNHTQSGEKICAVKILVYTVNFKFKPLVKFRNNPKQI